MTRPKWFAAVVTVLVFAPACSSSAGGLRGSGEGGGLGERLANRVAYRPVYPYPNPLPRTRALYLSGYAGASYGPVAPLSPTGFFARTGRHHHHQPARSAKLSPGPPPDSGPRVWTNAGPSG